MPIPVKLPSMLLGHRERLFWNSYEKAQNSWNSWRTWIKQEESYLPEVKATGIKTIRKRQRDAQIHQWNIIEKPSRFCRCGNWGPTYVAQDYTFEKTETEFELRLSLLPVQLPSHRVAFILSIKKKVKISP